MTIIYNSNIMRMTGGVDVILFVSLLLLLVGIAIAIPFMTPHGDPVNNVLTI